MAELVRLELTKLFTLGCFQGSCLTIRLQLHLTNNLWSERSDLNRCVCRSKRLRYKPDSRYTLIFFMVGQVGLEPTVLLALDLQSSGFTNSPTTPNLIVSFFLMAESVGLEPEKTRN